MQTPSSLILIDKDRHALYFDTKYEGSSLIYWGREKEDWICPISKKSINQYYDNAKLTPTDFLYYFVDELIKTANAKKPILETILKLEKLLNKFHENKYYYPFNDDKKVLDYPILTEHGIDPHYFEVFHRNYEEISFSEMELMKKSYAKMCKILKEIHEIHAYLDEQLSKYKVHQDTVVASNKKSAIYYHQLKDIFQPYRYYGIRNRDNNIPASKVRVSKDIVNDLLKYSYKVKNGKWLDKNDCVKKDYITIKEKNITNLTRFNESQLPATCFLAVKFRQTNYSDSFKAKEFSRFEDLRFYPLIISKEQSNIFSSLSECSQEHALVAKVVNGRIAQLIYNYTIQKEPVNNYLFEINVELEKNLLQIHVAPKGVPSIYNTNTNTSLSKPSKI